MIQQLTHPTSEQLSAFSLGRLPPEDAAVVETHIGECQPCCETLLGLASDDTFVGLLREANQPPSEQSIDPLTGWQAVSAATDDETPPPLVDHPRYAIVAPVGKGGMGDVFRAEHRMMERTVALKIINRELFRNSEAVERFHREVKTAAKLSHPNIVTAYDAEQAGDVHFLVMEFVDGVDLARRVKEGGALPIDEACECIRQAALGLEHARGQGMVHRDIKPHNLMVTGDGTVKILDFGLATFATEALPSQPSDEPAGDLPAPSSTSRLTGLGTMMGTPDFISPEQASEPHAVDIRSDIYSLGCTFYYLLTGRPPFTEGDVMDKVQAHAEVEPEPIENVRDDIPSELAAVARRMMAKQPNQRFQSPAEVVDALSTFVDPNGPRRAEQQIDKHAEVAVAPARSWRPPKALTATALAALALIFAAILYVTTDGGTFVVDSVDESVEITVRPVNGNTKDGKANRTGWQFRLTDTVTGSTAKWLRSGEYELDLKGDNNNFKLNKDRFVLKRGGKVIVKVTRREDSEHERKKLSVAKVLEKPVFGGAPSPDGRYVSHPLRSDLAVRDLISGTSRRLTKNPESGEFAYIQVWSPNGKEIVTSWWLPDEHQFDLRIVPLDGGSPRTIYFDKDHYVHPYGWSNNGEILIGRWGSDKTGQLVLISAADGKERLLKSFGWKGPSAASISPDGRHVVYEMPQEDDSSKLDIFILSTEEGGVEERLVEHPGHDHAPFWALDGRRVVFTSDRNGSDNLWVLAVENGRHDGFPHSVNIDMTRVKPLGITEGGTYFYSNFSSGKSDVYVAKFDTKKRVISGKPAKITHRYEGFNSKPAWSQDGRYLAFVSDGIQKDGLVIQSVENNEQRVLNASHEFGFFFNGRPRWSPNGKHILSSEGRDGKGRWGIQSIDAESGTVTSLIPPTNDDKDRPSSAAWSSDGQIVFYIRNVFQKNTFASKVAASTLGTNEERILHENTDSRRSDEYYPPKLYFSLAVSPDGEKIALATKNTISVMPVTGGDARIVHQVVQGRIPEAVGILWTRDGRSVIFGAATSRERAGGRLPQKNTRLWQVSIEDGSASEIGLVADDLSHIAMHPDGNKIAYTAAASGVSSEQRGTWAISNFLPPLVEAD